MRKSTANGKRKVVTKKLNHKQPEVLLNVLSNDPLDGHYSKLAAFYQGAYDNSISLMEARDRETGEIKEVLVAYKFDPETKTIETLYLAEILSMTAQDKFQAPDYKGGFVGYNDSST